MKKTAFIRSASAAAIFGLTLSLGGVTAVAQDGAPAAAPAAVIDENAPVTLTIDKRLNPTSIGAPGSGTTDPSATGNPLAGATFTGTLLDTSGVDPKQLGNLTADNYTELGAKKTGTTVTGETDQNGQLKFDSQNSPLEQGIWRFEETINGEVTDVKTGKTYQSSEVAPSTPFIVSLPYTNGEGNGWNYNVVVQPKNTTAGVTKEVKDEDKNVSDNINYVVHGNVPVIPNNEELQGFRLEDTIDTDNLELVDASVKLSNDDPIAEGTDYSLTVNKDANSENYGKVEVSFTKAGLTKLSRLDAGTTVDLTITAKVKELAGTDGIAVNKAQQFVHYPNQEEETKTESNEVKSYWGQVKVVKTEEGSQTPLKGAEFELYRCDGTETQANQLSDQKKISINGTSKWETADDGTVLIDGVHVTNVEDNSNQINKSYCLVETKAPRGFVATSEVHSFQLASSEDKLNTASPVQYEAQIKNKRSEMPQLPLTGGMGIGILGALAVLVAGGALWFARRANKES
ncbi:SpaH/EbpB family LPXTG-anchored major pilin [Corynebacterium accolens]|jgi:fimbrial subunit|uniref:SpaH/EbpB family LPXTG-anchored major pilin n=1 Tax=Corynebacterium accolens TaxID=38284 RepID=UPI0025429953|nr:SpaH/EbpB family LPXTG-anchored major pilin [Corynebacterium accolens]MDK4324873.1 SpaH/EbpB family LPXTG-anchored major pilin [Corynebacterium accolens]MDK8652335.1 SpaH/EbpB family LPXTG-anchored major pilin [Corynebacterium accolens]